MVGGYGSGRYRRRWTRDTVEDCTVLTVRDLIGHVGLAPNILTVSRGIAWYDTVKGEKTASISVDIDTGPRAGYARLHYTVEPLYGRGDEFNVDYKVPLVTTRPHFGGVRWWFLSWQTMRETRCKAVFPTGEWCEVLPVSALL